VSGSYGTRLGASDLSSLEQSKEGQVGIPPPSKGIDTYETRWVTEASRDWFLRDFVNLSSSDRVVACMGAMSAQMWYLGGTGWPPRLRLVAGTAGFGLSLVANGPVDRSRFWVNSLEILWLKRCCACECGFSVAEVQRHNSRLFGGSSCEMSQFAWCEVRQKSGGAHVAVEGQDTLYSLGSDVDGHPSTNSQLHYKFLN